MEIDELAGFSARHFMSHKYLNDFLLRENIYNDKILYILLNAYYLINEKGSCYMEELSILDPRIKKRAFYINIWYLAHASYLEVVGKSRHRGNEYKITIKGMNALNRYVSFLREKERECFWKMKELRKMDEEDG